MADPVIEPENYNDAAAVNTARKADDYTAPASPESAEDYPDIVLILSESFYDFDLVTDLQADTDIMPVTKNLTNAVYGHTISRMWAAAPTPSEYGMLSSNSLMLMPSITPFNWLNLHKGKQPGQQPERSGVCHAGSPPLYQLQLPPRFCLADAGL